MASAAENLLKLFGGGQIKRKKEFDLPDVTGEEFSLPEEGPFEQSGLGRFLGRLGGSTTDRELNQAFNNMLIQERLGHLRDSARINATNQNNINLEGIRDANARARQEQLAELQAANAGITAIGTRFGLSPEEQQDPAVRSKLLDAFHALQGQSINEGNLGALRAGSQMLLAPGEEQSKQRRNIAENFAGEQTAKRSTSDLAKKVVTQDLQNKLSGLQATEQFKDVSFDLPGGQSIPLNVLLQQPAFINMLGRVFQDPELQQRQGELKNQTLEADLEAQRLQNEIRKQIFPELNIDNSTNAPRGSRKPVAMPQVDPSGLASGGETIEAGGRVYLRTVNGLVPLGR